MTLHWGRVGIACVALGATLTFGLRGPEVRAASNDYSISYLDQDMNDGGTIVGLWWDPDTGELHAVKWASRTADAALLTEPDGYAGSNALQVNDRGDIVGYLVTSDAHHAAIWDKHGDVTDVHPSGYWYSELWSVNRHGDSVGVAIDDDYNFFPYIWPHDGDAEALFLDPDVYFGGWANSIDKNGNVAGEAYLVDSYGDVVAHAVVWWADGTFSDLHDEILATTSADLRETRAWMCSDDGAITGHTIGPDRAWGLPWVWTKAEGASLLDIGTSDVGDAWGLAGKAIVGFVDGWYYGGYDNATTAVWSPKKVRGVTTWVATFVSPPAGAKGFAALNGNTHGDICGLVVGEDDSYTPCIARK